MKARAPNHIVGVRVLLGLVVVLTEILFISYFASTAIELLLSSVAVTAALLVQLRYGLREDAVTPADIVVFVFDWLFLDLAPKIQLIGSPQQLVNTSSVNIDTAAVANLACAVFIVSFTLLYRTVMNRAAAAGRVRKPASVQQPPEFTPAAIGLALLACVVVVAIAAPAAYNQSDDAVVTPAKLIVGRFLLFLPSATLLILLQETVRSGRRLVFSRVCTLLLLLLLVVITENPHTEKRNALGPVYLGIVLIAFQDWFASRTKRLILLVTGMVVVFPAISIFTHNKEQSIAGLKASQFWNQIQSHYFSINYDSWANIYTSVEIVKMHGLQWGHQLLGSLLFFVPSSLWTTKPFATGIFIADYLIAHYSMWFTNLSAPLVCEAYVDFGFVGVVCYAWALALLVAALNRVAARQDSWAALPLTVYTSVFLMILLRGSLMIALGFGAAAFLAFRLASLLLSMRIGVRRRFVARSLGARTPLAS